MVSGEGVLPLPSKIEAVLQIPVPETITHLRSFLGMCNFFRAHPRKRKMERKSVRVFTAAVTDTAGGEAQGIEDSVSPPDSKEMETKIDDAPRNSKELHSHEEYEEFVKNGNLEIKQLLDMGVFVLPSDDEMEEIRSKNKRVLRCKMVYARKYESVMCDDGQIRDRFLKWKGRLAAVGTGEVKSLDTCWSYNWHDRYEDINCLNVSQRIRCAELRFVGCVSGHGSGSGSVRQVARRSGQIRREHSAMCENVVRFDHVFQGFREFVVGKDSQFRGQRWQVQEVGH
jgi:hypothetical protein